MVLSEADKGRILALHGENLSNRRIAQIVGCHESTVRRLLKKLSSTGKTERQPGSGRPKKTTARQDRILERMSLKNRFATAKELRKELNETCATDISTRSVQRRLNEVGLQARRPAKKPLLSAKMKKKRLAWAKEHREWTADDWRRVIFSDESKFNLIGPDGKQTVRRRANERYSDECLIPTVKHSPYVMVWGCMTNWGLGRILLLDGSVNAEKYKQIIADGVVPTIEELCCYVPNPIFQDDSAPCHRARSITLCKEDIGLESLNWPGNSPDLNIIENLWSIMGRKVRNKAPKTIAELKTVIKEVWTEDITAEEIKKLYDSMPRRVQAVIKAKGGATKY